MKKSMIYYNSNKMASQHSELIALVKERIRYFMKLKGVSFYELALRSGLSEVCIRNWYTARNYTPSLIAIEKVSAALGILPFELFCTNEDLMPVTPENRAILSKLYNLKPDQMEAFTTLLDRFNN